MKKSLFLQFKETSMVDFLIGFGYEQVNKTSTGTWFNSPFREEKSPSFKVRKGTTGIDIFYDFGDSSHGTMVDLAMRLFALDKQQLYEKLCGESLSFGQPIISQFQHITDENRGKILKIKSVNHPALLQYLNSRMINSQMANTYLQEIYYSSNDKKLFALGFQNDLGGYELRSKYTKRTMGAKSLTTIIGNPLDKRMALFEGVFDFLSYQTIIQVGSFLSDILPFENFCILNSTSQVQAFLSGKKFNEYSLYLFLDNDNAGNDATTQIIKTHPKQVQDCRSFYSESKDLNEWWLAKKGS